MENLFYDLVEEVVNFLPRKDVETIARVAKESQDLENWSIAAEDHLEKRFLLDVDVHIERTGKWNDPKVRLSVKKTLPGGLEEDWNFKQWRYAWLHRVNIYLTSESTYKEVEMEQVLRSVSLPVDPSASGILRLQENLRYPENAACLIDLSQKVLQATQKDFSYVIINHSPFISTTVFDDFIADIITQGVFLEHVQHFCRRETQQKIWEAAAPLFEKKRGRPLEIKLWKNRLECEHMELIIESWLKSDGTYESKEISYSASDTAWRTLRDKYKQILGGDYCGYLVHPTRHSSLYVSKNKIRVEEYEPWHLPIDFHWIDSFIGKWKKEEIRHMFYRDRGFEFAFEDAEDWDKLVEKYGPLDGSIMSIVHPSGYALLQLKKKGEVFEAVMSKVQKT
uniref:F-box domain-containing protein n=1 Tax=Steinernema glaseri TaxID=37863 RepID=A0A1I7YUP2_9BILA